VQSTHRHATSVVLQFVLSSAIALAGIAGLSSGRLGLAQAATTQSYVKTLVGLDFHSLDQAVFAELAPNTGGAMYPVALGDNVNNLPSHMYFEARVELPVGARVTDVTFYACGPSGNTSYYFGDYDPVAGAFQALLPEAHAPTSTCPQLRTLKQTGSPIATVAAGRSYHLGIEVFVVGNFRINTPIAMLKGARVRYTCTSACR
jgi:hypothetical protein